MTEKLRLGDILVAKKVITEAQKEKALELQKSSGELFGSVLIKQGWATEIKILTALSEQFKMPFVRLDPTVIDWNAAKIVSPTILEKHTMIPIKKDANSITLAISDPLDVWGASEVESHARGRIVELVLATRQDILSAIREFGKRQLESNAKKTD